MALVNNLQSHFQVSEPFKQEDELHVEKLSEVGTLDPLPQEPYRQGVLMVMMENYEAKSGKFLPSGKIAVGIKLTKEGKEIINHVNDIGYILFHVRSDDKGLHLFVTKSCSIMLMADLSSDIYTNTRKELFYVMVEFDTKQSDIPVLHVSKKPPMTEQHGLMPNTH